MTVTPRDIADKLSLKKYPSVLAGGLPVLRLCAQFRIEGHAHRRSLGLLLERLRKGEPD